MSIIRAAVAGCVLIAAAGKMTSGGRLGHCLRYVAGDEVEARKLVQKTLRRRARAK